MDNPKLSSDLRNILGGDDALTMLADAASQQNDIQFKAILASSIAQIDKLLSEQLSDVIQHKEFKALESSWSGLYGLCNLPVSQRRIKIKLLDMSWNRLSTDLNLSFDLKRSTLYKKKSICRSWIPLEGILSVCWWWIIKFRWTSLTNKTLMISIPYSLFLSWVSALYVRYC